MNWVSDGVLPRFLSSFRVKSLIREQRCPHHLDFPHPYFACNLNGLSWERTNLDQTEDIKYPSHSGDHLNVYMLYTLNHQMKQESHKNQQSLSVSWPWSQNLIPPKQLPLRSRKPLWRRLYLTPLRQRAWLRHHVSWGYHRHHLMDLDYHLFHQSWLWKCHLHHKVHNFRSVLEGV